MKAVNKTPNILLNYLQIGNPLDVFDLSNFLPKTQILKLYQDVASNAVAELMNKIQKAKANFEKATTSSEKGIALNALSDKYSEIKKQLRNGADISSMLAVLQQLYDDEPERLIDAQILAANEFMSSSTVQDKVALDFEGANYKAFDVNNGDNNCQSRIFLMDIFEQHVPYASLTQSEQLVLTLCNITSQYKKEVRDVFGLLLKDVDNGGVRIKVAAKIETKTTAFYSVGDLISQAISQISTGYLLQVADVIGDSSLKHDLLPYARKEQNSAKTKPVQQLQASGICAMYGCIALKEYPFAYKVTRLATTSLGEFVLQGTALLDMNCDRIVSLSTDSAIIFELYAVDTPKAKAKSIGTSLQGLASANSFDEYLVGLKAYGIQKLINFCDAILDRQLQQKDVVYSAPEIMACAKDSKMVEKCLSSCYVVGKQRSEQGVIFSPCHIYVSSFSAEITKLEELEASSPKAGLAI